MFFTGLSNYLPNCVLGTSSKDVSSSCSSWGWQYCIFPASSPLPALSIFVSSVRINEYLLCIQSLCACDCYHHFSDNENTRSPEIWGRRNFVRTRQNLFFCCCFWLCCISGLGKYIWGVISPFFRPVVNLYSPTRDSHAIVSNQETQLNTSESSVQCMEPFWLPAMVLKE